jgi:hypothetical protein
MQIRCAQTDNGKEEKSATLLKSRRTVIVNTQDINIAHILEQKVVVSYGRQITLLYFAEGSGAA